MFALAHSVIIVVFIFVRILFVFGFFYLYLFFVDTNSPIIFMVALDNSAIVVRFAALDNLSHIAVDLKHPLLSLKEMSLRLGILGK